MAIAPLQLPGAFQSPSVDIQGSLSQLGQQYQKAQAEQGIKDALAGGIGNDPQSLSALAGKVAQYNPQMGFTLAQLATSAANTQYQHGRDDKNDARQATQDATANQHWAASYALQKAASDRAGEDKFGIKEVTDPNTGATSFVKFNQRTGDVAPASGYTPPVSAPNNPFSSGGKFNGDQGKAAGFTDRMLGAEAVLSGVGPTPGEQGPVSPGVQEQGKNWLQRDLNQAPFGVSNMMISNDQQKFNQSKADFINAQLRRESGAAIGKDEYTNADKQYFPQPGDGPEVIRQKAANRRSAIEAMGREGGGSYKPKLNYGPDGTLVPYGQPVAQPQQSQPAPQAAPAPPQRGQLVQGYRFKGGDPSDQSNWVKAQ